MVIVPGDPAPTDAPSIVPTVFDLGAYFGDACEVYRGDRSYPVQIRFSSEVGRPPMPGRSGRFAWSGHNASGDPGHVHALGVDVGHDFLITSDQKLYLTGPGPQRFKEFAPDGFDLATRSGMFGFRVMTADELASQKQDKENKRRQKLGRRGKSAEGQQKQEKAPCDAPDTGRSSSSPSKTRSPGPRRRSAAKKPHA